MNKLTVEQLRALAVKKVETLKFSITQSAYTGIRCRLEEELQLAEFALAAMDSESVEWLNGCNKSVPAALRYLAENPRPIGGESSFNTAHLYQLAREIELMAEAPLYRHAQPVPVVQDGYVMVPKVPTEDMVIAGFESEPDEDFSEPGVWEAYEDMSGCEQAAYRARLCWAAMLAAVPQEAKGE